MLSKEFEDKVRNYTQMLVGSTLATTRISPDAITLMSLVLTMGVVALLAMGALPWAGLLFLIASGFDMLDGALARSRGEHRPFGAFLDSTIDRYAEMLVFLGLLLYYYHAQAASGLNYALLIFLASHGSLLTSYIRARAEAVGFDGRGGILDRPGRVIVLALGMLSGWLTPSLIILAVLTNLSALQRFARVWSQAHQA
ncbi:MAG: CDP-alcohol phosphatidyltransferase family protein [Oscillochloridaceae bacterium umkhey_bin13]